MKLDKFLQSHFTDTDILYIGSMSGYFFIGTKEQFYKDNKELSEHWIANFTKCVRDNEFKLKTAQETKFDLKSYEIKVRKQEHSLYIKKPLTDAEIKANFKKEVEKRNNAIANLKRTVKRNKHKLDTFKPFDKREVQRCYVKDVEKGYAIIVSGYECASFWFKKEYDKTKGREIEEEWEME